MATGRRSLELVGPGLSGTIARVTSPPVLFQGSCPVVEVIFRLHWFTYELAGDLAGRPERRELRLIRHHLNFN